MTPQVSPSLTPFFNPQGIVLFGASPNPTKLGFGLARNLVQSGYRGAIHFVNPRGGALLERPVYRSLADVPDPADLAVLLLPAELAPETLEACGQRGIRAAILASGGFRETNETGAQLEEACLATARRHDMRLIGPNCIGLINTHLPLDTTFLPPPGPTPGDVAFISHSGAICAAVIDWSRGQGFGLSQLVSLGNQADVTETDVLGPVAADRHTRVITLYLEGIGNGRRFVQQAAQISRQKPIIAVKVGRFAAGQKAAASHTGALSGSESAFNAAFRRAGVIRADNSEAQFDWARALAWCPLPNGPNVAVLTNAGGPGVTAADALEAEGLQLASLGADSIAKLQAILPPFASLHNPVDMLASASPEQYADALRILLADPGVNSVLIVLPPPPMYATGAVARALIPVIYATGKPVVVALMGERLIQEAVEHFRAARVPEFRFPERAASALAVLARRAAFLAQEAQPPVVFDDVQPEIVRAVLASKPQNDSTNLPTESLNKILAAYGIRTPPLALAESAAAAVHRANTLGYPVVLKIASPDIQHKSDVGGVLLHVTSPEAVAQGFAALVGRARAARPTAVIQGVYVQPLIPGGQEVIIGAVQDPQFGPVLMFGSGGVEVEGLRDVAFALAPLTAADADYLLADTWAGRKLAGYRNIMAGDSTAVRDTLFRLAQLVHDFPQLAEIEINPLRVLPGQGGVYAVDVRAVTNANGKSL
ncbi:MAG: acetate--CoA ligase family protein [Chloroflexi bacterium]|nr:acetate--CoA ligase family protein [Chloroflexota bacterium]